MARNLIKLITIFLYYLSYKIYKHINLFIFISIGFLSTVNKLNTKMKNHNFFFNKIKELLS